MVSSGHTIRTVFGMLTSYPTIRVRIPSHISTLTPSLKAHNRHLLPLPITLLSILEYVSALSPRSSCYSSIILPIIILTRHLHTSDMQLQTDQAESFSRLDWLTLAVRRNPAVFEVEGVEVVVVEEADYTHPRACYAVGILGVEGGVQGCGEFAGETVGGVGAGSEALEGLVPEVV